jgi:hypothetical protein
VYRFDSCCPCTRPGEGLTALRYVLGVVGIGWSALRVTHTKYYYYYYYYYYYKLFSERGIVLCLLYCIVLCLLYCIVLCLFNLKLLDTRFTYL